MKDWKLGNGMDRSTRNSRLPTWEIEQQIGMTRAWDESLMYLQMIAFVQARAGHE